MKILNSILLLFLSGTVYAGETCEGFSKFAGKYELVSISCERNFTYDPFGQELIIESTTTDAGYEQIWIRSNGFGVGPSTAPNDLARCRPSPSGLSIDPTGECSTCIPQWTYHVNYDTFRFYVGTNCFANYKKL